MRFFVRVTRRWTGSILLGFVALACSDGDDDGPGASGVDRGKYLDELTLEELGNLCQWSTPAQGGAAEHDCDGFTLTTPSVEECSAESADIHCTVAQVEDCVSSTGGDPCKTLSTEPCAAYLTCALETDGVTSERRLPLVGRVKN